MIDDFETMFKKTDSHEELDQLDAKILELGEMLDQEELPQEDDTKRQYKSKEGDRTVNRIMSRIYTELTTDYDKKVYNPTENLLQ